MNEVSPEKIAKLPVWAQDHIKDLERRANNAERTLKEYRDGQTPSPIFTEEWAGSKMDRRYIQHHRVSIERDGVKLDVLLREDDKGIDLCWADNRRLVKEIAMVPVGFNHVKLVVKEDIR